MKHPSYRARPVPAYSANMASEWVPSTTRTESERSEQSLNRPSASTLVRPRSARWSRRPCVLTRTASSHSVQGALDLPVPADYSVSQSTCHSLPARGARPVERREVVMKKWGRRIRAAIGMGLTWGAAWFGAGILLARVPGFYSDLPFALLFAPLGFVTGIIFSGISRVSRAVAGLIARLFRALRAGAPEWPSAVRDLRRWRGPSRGGLVERVPGIRPPPRHGERGLRCWFAGPSQTG